MTSQSSYVEVFPAAAVETVSERRARDGQSVWVFAGWCLRRETLRFWPYAVLLLPLLAAGAMTYFVILNPWYPRQGKHLSQALLILETICVVASGIRYGSTAVCGELSREQLDLIRLTNIHPLVLLWFRSLARWWTIVLSLWLVVPLVIYARTLGGTWEGQWLASFCAIAMTVCLFAGFSMRASVANLTANNPQLAAPKSTFNYALLYQASFQLLGAVIVGIHWCLTSSDSNTSYMPPNGSTLRTILNFVNSTQPIGVIYQAIAEPEFFTPWSPQYLLHFVTAIIFSVSASWSICHRFWILTETGEPLAKKDERPEKATASLFRMRCTDRPFFWKESHVFYPTISTARFIAKALCFVASGALILVVFGGDIVQIQVATMAVLTLPVVGVIAIYDESLAVEFREQTWVNLMVLPVDRRWIIWEKIRAAVAEVGDVWIPVVAASGIGLWYQPMTVLISLVVLPFAFGLMLEVSTLNQLNSRYWWSAPALLVFVASLIFGIAAVWATSSISFSCAITVAALLSVDALFFAITDWRLRTWSDN